nr:DUF4405 domain-containing protein [Agrobacterium tumefaciens]
MAALAYNWLDNTAHEIIGTAMFALLATHIVFNRRWFAGLKRMRWEPSWLLTRTVNLALLLTMLALLVTSVIISQTVFSFLDMTSTFTVRQIHSLVGYLALMIAGVHIGLQWKVVMAVVRGRLGLSPPHSMQTGFLRGLTFVIAAYGAYSLAAVNVGTKLTMTMTMEFWDFETQALAFFTHLTSILGLGVTSGHYLSRYLGPRRPPTLTTNSDHTP